MTRIVYKYDFFNSELTAPHGLVRLVADQAGDGMPTIWIEHDLSAPATAEYFIRPTGAEFTVPHHHVGSCICGSFVWHVYRKN